MKWSVFNVSKMDLLKRLTQIFAQTYGKYYNGSRSF